VRSNDEINHREANQEVDDSKIETLEQASVDDLSETPTVDLNHAIPTEATNGIFPNNAGMFDISGIKDVDHDRNSLMNENLETDADIASKVSSGIRHDRAGDK
jgi:hypothetical protein